ncbi:hypothetical protein PLEOSDRAFT_166568 [Pleurotus ostreatus PC15]|uniref:Uncharacterized protein n=1 Tax=Pleurotus ostreatus (strain PC15) TaxID=1137138 RepID=A0A067NWJ6_PLEO1|nr:hypothetical protein PLEOSDRAFT_166568 [Pleurotus ostreatus PC15]
MLGSEVYTVVAWEECRITVQYTSHKSERISQGTRKHVIMKWRVNGQEPCQRLGEVGTRSNEVGKEDRGNPDEPRSVSTSPSESEASERVRGEPEAREDFGVTGRGSDAKGVNGREAERAAHLAEGESKENRIRILHARKQIHQPQVRANITRYKETCDNEVEGKWTGAVPATWGMSPSESEVSETSPSESEVSETSPSESEVSEVREDSGVTGRGSDAKGVGGKEVERKGSEKE